MSNVTVLSSGPSDFVAWLNEFADAGGFKINSSSSSTVTASNKDGDIFTFSGDIDILFGFPIGGTITSAQLTRKEGDVVKFDGFSVDFEDMIDAAEDGAEEVVKLFGDLTLTGDAGADVLTGAAGTDTAVYTGARSGYVVAAGSDGAYTVTANGVTDTLKNVEKVQFGSETFEIKALLDTTTPPPAGNTAPALTGTKVRYGTGTEDVAYKISAAALLSGYTDAENDTLSVVNVKADRGTVLVGRDGSYTLIPEKNYSGTVKLSYGVSDGKLTTAAMQDITIKAANDAPVLTLPKGSKGSLSVAENTKFAGKFAASDVDSKTLTWSVDKGYKDGKLFSVDAKGNLSFAAAPDYEAPKDAGKNNVYDVKVVLTDDKKASAAQIVSVKVTDENKVKSGDGKANTLKGTSGEDSLYGKAGNDTLKGDKGQDTFVFDTALSSGKTKNVDLITDFSAKDDRIALDNKIFAGIGKDKTWLDGDFFKDLGQKGAKVDKSDHILYNSKTGVLSYDSNTSDKKAAIQFAQIGEADAKSHAVLTAGDFWIV